MPPQALSYQVAARQELPLYVTGCSSTLLELEMRMARILIVDDEIAIVDVLQTFLEEKGHKVFTAYDGEDAVETAKRERPHMILLDIYLPKMDGIEVLRTVKEFDEAVGVIMITAFREEDVARQALKLGAFDYITKPFDFEYLERALEIKLQLMLM
jgi:DNA-binding response OmpR family regulator